MVGRESLQASYTDSRLPRDYDIDACPRKEIERQDHECRGLVPVEHEYLGEEDREQHGPVKEVQYRHPRAAKREHDGFSNPNTAIPPIGPGFWTSSTVPPTPVAGGQLPGMTRWFLTSANQFRPGLPPAFGFSFNDAAITEIRQI